MGHGTDQFSILQDRASGQSLHDSAGQLQQVLILHMKTDSLIFISRCIIKIINYDAIRLQFPGRIRQNYRILCLNLLFVTDRTQQTFVFLFFPEVFRQRAIDTDLCIAGHFSDLVVFPIIDNSLQLSRCSPDTFFDTEHLCFVQPAV